MKKINFHVIISGRVQGVWFRQSTKQKAEQLGIKGWVRNKSDGTVEAVFEGETEAVSKMIDWCHQGPNLSKVKDVKTTRREVTEGLEDFSVKD